MWKTFKCLLWLWFFRYFKVKHYKIKNDGSNLYVKESFVCVYFKEIQVHAFAHFTILLCVVFIDGYIKEITLLSCYTLLKICCTIHNWINSINKSTSNFIKYPQKNKASFTRKHCNIQIFSLLGIYYIFQLFLSIIICRDT